MGKSSTYKVTKEILLSLPKYFCLIAILSTLIYLPVFAQGIKLVAFEEEFLFFSDEDIASIATLAKKPIARSPGIISVITSKTISNMAARNLVDVLKTVPGFDVRYSNFGEYFLSIRGVDSPSHILMMINGHRANNFFDGAALYDIPVDNIERIEIIRGPGSALYGTNAMVGAINIITKKEKGFKAKVGGGNHGTYKGNFLFGTEKDEWSVYGFAEFYSTDGAGDIIEADRLTTINPDYSKTPGKMKDDKEKINVHLDLMYKEVDFGFNLYHEDRGPNVAYLDIYSDRSRVVSDYISLDISKDFNITDSAKLSPRIYVDRWKVDKNIQLYPDEYSSLRDLDGDGSQEFFPDGEWFNKSYESWTYGTDWRLINKIGESHALTVGAAVEQMELKNTSIKTNYIGEPDIDSMPRTSLNNWNQYNFPEKSRTVHAVYLQEDWTPNKYVNVVAGVRYDHYSDFGNTTNPRVAVSFFPAEKANLKIQYATAFRAPTFKELYDETDIQFSGNPDLNPEKIETIELGAGYTFRKNTFLRGNLFKNTIKDDIATLFEFTRAGVTTNQNVGEQEIKGWEIEANYTFESGSNLYLNASQFNIKDKLTDTWLTRIPQFRANMLFSKTLPLKSRATVTWMYTDASSSNSRTNQERLPQNRASAGPYSLINMAFIKNDIFKGIKLKISAFNILNTDYRELFSDIRYRLPNDANRSSGLTVQAPILIPTNQRTFFIEIQKDFK